MNKYKNLNHLRVGLLMALIFLATVSVQADEPIKSAIQGGSSPLPSLIQKTVEYIATQENIPLEAIVISDLHVVEFANLERKFQAFKLVDTRNKGQIYRIVVDLETGQVLRDIEISTFQLTEKNDYQSKYGKIHPDLYARLQRLDDKDMLQVAVWTASPPGSSLVDMQQKAFSALAEEYRHIKVPIEDLGKPFDIEDAELAKQLYAEYKELMRLQIHARTQPLINQLEQRGFEVNGYNDIPSFTATLPKYMILELNDNENVERIYLADAKVHPELDSAVPNSLAPTVWARGYDGSGVTLAMFDNGNVDPNNDDLNLSPLSYNSSLPVTNHATLVASCAASDHSTYKGMASGATIVSVGVSTDYEVIDAIEWASNIGQADVINMSIRIVSGDSDILDWIDRAADYWSRWENRLIVKSAGNTGGSITSPGKAWNVLTVGGYTDHNNPQWNDEMWEDSAYINPDSFWHDREKPEIVAVADSITGSAINNNVITRTGTSVAAPQVTGLAALMIHRNSQLVNWPEAARSIIMASANHNITGHSIILPVNYAGDQEDGAGAINADLADEIARTRGSSIGTCLTSCWWGESITNSNLPVNGDLFRSFYAEQGELIRVAINWWSNADSNYYSDRLDTDLDLTIRDPNGNWVTSSLSYDNNYEMVQFFAPRSGNYTIQVHKSQAYEDANFVGIAVVRIPTDSVYLPIVLKNAS